MPLNKTIIKHNQLRPNLEYSPWNIRICTSDVLLAPLTNVAAISQESPSKFLITSKTWYTVTSSKLSRYGILRLGLDQGARKTCPIMATDRETWHRWKIMCDVFFKKVGNIRTIGLGQVREEGLGLGRRPWLGGELVGDGAREERRPRTRQAGGRRREHLTEGHRLERGRRHTSFYLFFL
jgi:hypothetical protein